MGVPVLPHRLRQNSYQPTERKYLLTILSDLTEWQRGVVDDVANLMLLVDD